MLTGRWREVCSRVLLGAVILGGGLSFRAASAKADDDDCQRRVARADHRLHEAAERHGWESPQAEHWRHELHEARERCWRERRRWWDEDARRWRSDRDWDDRDHDRPH